MDTNGLSQSPFAVLTFIVAPAILTNATSVLAMSTINRMLRTRDRMHELFTRFEENRMSDNERPHFLAQVNRVEHQASLLLRALRCIYIALGAFAGAALMTLLGASLAHFQGAFWFRFLAGFGLLLGFIGVGSLITGSVHLLKATQISLVNISEEADLIRKMHPLTSVQPENSRKPTKQQQPRQDHRDDDP
jgi:hypothetical protein